MMGTLATILLISLAILALSGIVRALLPDRELDAIRQGIDALERLANDDGEMRRRP